MRISKTLLLSVASILFFLPGTASATGAPAGMFELLIFLIFIAIVMASFAKLLLYTLLDDEICKPVAFSVTFVSVLVSILIYYGFSLSGNSQNLFSQDTIHHFISATVDLLPLFFLSVGIEYFLLTLGFNKINENQLLRTVFLVNIIAFGLFIFFFAQNV